MLKIVLLAVCCAFYAVALDPAGPSLIISFGVDPGDTTYSPQTFTLPIPDAGEQTSIINTQGHTWNYFRIVQWPAQAAGASFAFYNGGNYVGEMDVHELDTGDSWQYGREYTLGQFNGGTLHGAPVDAGGYQTPEEEVMTVEDQRNQDAQAQAAYMGMHLIDTGKFGAIGPRSLDSPEVLVYQTGCPDGCPCSTATTGAPKEFAACTTGTSSYVWVASPTVAVNTFCLVWGTCNSQKYDWQAGWTQEQLPGQAWELKFNIESNPDLRCSYTDAFAALGQLPTSGLVYSDTCDPNAGGKVWGSSGLCEIAVRPAVADPNCVAGAVNMAATDMSNIARQISTVTSETSYQGLGGLATGFSIGLAIDVRPGTCTPAGSACSNQPPCCNGYHCQVFSGTGGSQCQANSA